MRKMKQAPISRLGRRNSDGLMRDEKSGMEGLVSYYEDGQKKALHNPDSYDLLNMIYIQTNLVEELFKSTF